MTSFSVSPCLVSCASQLKSLPPHGPKKITGTPFSSGSTSYRQSQWCQTVVGSGTILLEVELLLLQMPTIWQKQAGQEELPE